ANSLKSALCPVSLSICVTHLSLCVFAVGVELMSLQLEFWHHNPSQVLLQLLQLLRVCLSLLCIISLLTHAPSHLCISLSLTVEHSLFHSLTHSQSHSGTNSLI